jgi:hypothetical protein
VLDSFKSTSGTFSPSTVLLDTEMIIQMTSLHFKRKYLFLQLSFVFNFGLS